MAAPFRPNHIHGKLGEPVDPPVADGHFARFFEKSSVSTSDASLADLAKSMFSAGGDGRPAAAEAVTTRESAIPAGYTYLAQFIDHDLTFDPLSSLKHNNDVRDLVDLRSPRFDLDSLYGTGPIDQPYLYTPDPDGGLRTMLLGRMLGERLVGLPDDKTPRDVPRTTPPDITIATPLFSPPGGRAIIGDPRNDENVIVSQLHALFLRFHNRIAKDMNDGQFGDIQ